MTLFNDKNIDWDLIEVFCLVARSNGFRKAARYSGVSVQTISRRVALLEKHLDARVFSREHQGVKLTDIGKKIYDDAVAAENHITNINRISRRNLISNQGLVSANISEGIGTFWLTPRLGYYRKKSPKVVLDYKISTKLSNVNSQEVDIVVQLTKPSNNKLICRKLGCIHLGLYCSKNYHQYKSLPTSFDEFKDHTFVYQGSEQVDQLALLDFINAPDNSDVVKYTVNSSLSLYQLIRTNNCIGILPTYTSALTDNLIYIPSSPRGFKVELWVGFQEDARHYKPASNFIDWLIESFDANQFPWFGESFVHPDDIAALDRNPWRENLATFLG